MSGSARERGGDGMLCAPRSESFCMTAPVQLLTPTWSGDLPHFRLLRASLARSPLAHLPHRVVVQDEDLGLFEAEAAGAELCSSAEVLPPAVEAGRRRARRMQQRLGRHGTRLAGSLCARRGWPAWVRYTGWHAQQISKLAAAAESAIDTVVVLDSDVVVLPDASESDFLDADGRVVCFQRWAPADEVRGKLAKWNRQAHALFGGHLDEAAPHDVCFDTPFVLHAPTLRAMLAELERRYAKPWWQALIEQPPRHWSEFASYRRYLRAFLPPESVAWRDDGLLRYIFDAQDPEAVREAVAGMMTDPGVHYVTIHSQSAGRGLWGAEGYAERLLPLLDAG